MRKVKTFLPPQDGQEWVTWDEAAAMVGLTKDYFREVAKKWDYTMFRERHPYAPCWYLKAEMQKWAELRALRRNWLRNHRKASRYPRWTEKADLEWARGIFITTKEAAAILRGTCELVRRLVRRGRLVCYQARPGQRGSQLWFSRRAVEQLNEDAERAKFQEADRKGKAHCAEHGRHGLHAARMVRAKIPAEWLTTREAAERLGVHPGRLREMRETGRIRGERLWGRRKPLRYWYFPLWEVERLLADESYMEARAKWKARQEKVSLIDKIQMGRPKTLTCDEDLSQALRPMFTSDIWKLPPEPDWACDRRRL